MSARLSVHLPIYNLNTILGEKIQLFKKNCNLRNSTMIESNGSTHL